MLRSGFKDFRNVCMGFIHKSGMILVLNKQLTFKVSILNIRIYEQIKTEVIGEYSILNLHKHGDTHNNTLASRTVCPNGFTVSLLHNNTTGNSECAFDIQTSNLTAAQHNHNNNSARVCALLPHSISPNN